MTNENNKKRTHQCADGYTYEWITRVPDPRCCPRCKNHLWRSAPKVIAVKKKEE